MPRPTPTGTEAESEFIQRCMIDTVMRDDFPDSDVRRSECQQRWNGKSADTPSPAGMPTPTGGESQSEFMDRCMLHETTLNNFPHRPHRIAACQREWDRGKSRKSAFHERLLGKFEIKGLLSDNQFEGYGSTFGNVDLGGDIVLPGAFKSTLAAHKKAGKWPQMFWGHDMMQIPGVWNEMSEDSTGLYVKGTLLTKTQLGMETYELVKAKAVRGLSIGFAINDYKKDVEWDGDGHRQLKKIDLWEVSLVSMPMNEAATVEGIKTTRQLEHYLRDVKGFSQSEAKRVIAGIPRHLLKLTDQEIRDVSLPRDVDVDETAVQESIEALVDNISASLFRR